MARVGDEVGELREESSLRGSWACVLPGVSEVRSQGSQKNHAKEWGTWETTETAATS